MKKTIQLTATQQQILIHAAQTSGGKLEGFPDNLKGGARKKVIDSLFNRALITSDGSDWFLAAEGYDAIGLPRPQSVDSELESAVCAIEEKWKEEAVKPRSRANSKQAQVIEMLKRPEGTTVSQIIEATGWQAHTVRGTLAGVVKKKLGLTLTSEKHGSSERVYRIV